MSEKDPRQRRLTGFDDPPLPTDSVVCPSGRLREVPTQVENSLAGKSVFAVDAHSLIYQVFHALPEMTSPSGQPVGAVYGFVRDVLFLLEQKSPDYLFCAFDLPGPTFRHELYDQYKINRDAMPEDLRPQIPLIRRLLDVLAIPVLQCESYEADDVLATLAHRCDQLGADCYVVTSDKDCRQLITDRVRLYNVRKDELFDADSLVEQWGVRPDQVVDFQALVGDPVDNVPGVPLIGPKIASELLKKYGTLDSVLEHASEVNGKKRRQNLIDGKELAMLSRELVRLVRELPIEIEFREVQSGNVDFEAADELFRELGFRGLADRFRKWAESDVEAGTDSASSWVVNYKLVRSPQELDNLVQLMERQERIAVDTETTSLVPRAAELVGFSFAWQEGEAYYVPVRAPQGEPCLDLRTTLEALRGILENPAIAKVGQNLKYDKIVLRSAGVELEGISFDTMIASYLLGAGDRDHSLDQLSRRYLGHETIKYTDLVGSGQNSKRIDEVPVAQVTDYAAEDADVAWRLSKVLDRGLTELHLDKLYQEVELPLIEVLVDMEFNGIKVDTERLASLSARFGTYMQELEEQIYELAGRQFNIASPKQLGAVLFDELQLPVIKKMKTGPSTDAEVLEQLASQHPLPRKIIDFRQYAKLKNTYVDALPAMVNAGTDRVHTSFNQVVAATGRLSSNEPNLQNIPVRTQEGREIRSAFLAGDPGWRLLAADYSQIELRVLAHFSRDETLCGAFHQGEDIHARVASEVYDVPLPEVTSDMRRSAKAINFGVIYGQTPFGLAKALDIDREEAASFIESYFARYPGVDEFCTHILADCRKKGFVSTILGRRRAIQGVRDPQRAAQTPHQRTLPERTAINTVIQGSAADLIKQAMINLRGRLRRDKSSARMLLQIHDELILEVPSGDVEELAGSVVEEMTQVQLLAVPLKVDVKFGVNWAQCEPLE